MLDIVSATSASVHALTGSSRPGAVPPLVTFGGTAPPAAPHPDAAVIDLAGRVAILAHRERALWGRRSAIEDAVAAAMPPWPVTPPDPTRVSYNVAEIDGCRYTTLIETPGPTYDFRADCEAHEAAMAERERLEVETGERLGLPQWEKLADRAASRLERWGSRLSRLPSSTQAGLKAKAEVAQVCAEGQSSLLSGWRQQLATSISADALRIIGAEAEACVHSDRMVELYREAMAMMSIADDPAIDAETSSSAVDRANALEQIAMTTPPRTLNGAIACIEWALADHMRFRMIDLPDQGDHLLMALLTGALAVLRDAQEAPRLASAA